MDEEYQLIVPALDVAPKVTVPVPHLDAPVTEVIFGAELIVAITELLFKVVHPLYVAET